MDLSFSETQEMLKSTARDFIRRESPRDVLLALDETEDGFDPHVWQKVANAGWLGLVIPEEYGGMGSGFTDAGALFEELGKAPYPGPIFVSGILGALIIAEAGSAAQKESLLPSVADGSTIVTLAQTEADYDWGPAGINLHAERSGNGFVLQGEKVFVPYGAAATHYLVAARTRPGAGADGISLFVVDRCLPGVSVRTLRGFTKWSAVLRCDGLQLPASAALGPVDRGWEPLQQAIVKALPVLSAYMVGGCQSTFDMSLSHSQTRIQFGQPVGRFQFVQDNIISIVNYLDGARLAAFEALWKIDAGKPAAPSAHLAKALCSDAYYQCCVAAHKVHGGLGYAKDYGLTLHTSMSRALFDLLGNPAHHRARLAKHVLAGTL